ncbi:MAG TPA: HAMP domain-containing sensor histidine kinase [Candidatus Saccharimonadales bacterium]
MHNKLFQRLFLLHPTAAARPEREVVFILLLTGTFLVTSALFVLLLTSFALANNTYVFSRILLCLGAFAIIGGIYWLWRLRRYQYAAQLLVLFYGVQAFIIITTWGINTPFGILLIGFTIVLAGILQGPRHSLYAAAWATIVLMILQLIISAGIYHPQLSPTITPSHFGDVIGYSILFGIMALVSWLFGKRMEASLEKARNAEAELLKEKELLEVRVAERTLELEALQFQEMQQLYRFAEMGQLSAALLHDLANHLTVLTLDIEDLQHSEQRSQAVTRAMNSVRYLDRMVEKVRDQLQGDNQERRFSVTNRIKETVTLLQQQSRSSNVAIELHAEPRQGFSFTGDPTRFSQAVAILAANAVDAYENDKNKNNKVVIDAIQSDKYITVSVKDWGIGISNEVRGKLFQPFYSTKKTGMGIGLFIAQQIIEKHFKGKLSLGDSREYTEFIITIPRKSDEHE